MAAASKDPHVPVAVLADGTRLYAPHGSMKVIDAGAAVVCHACGNALAHISADHLRRHGLTGASYRQRFGLNRKQALTATSLSAARASEGSRRWRGNAGVQAGLAAGQALARSGSLKIMADAARAGEPARTQARRRVATSLRQTRMSSRDAATARYTQKVEQAGYPTLAAYLDDRYTKQRRPLSAIAAELHVSPTQVRRLLNRHGVERRQGRAHD